MRMHTGRILQSERLKKISRIQLHLSKKSINIIRNLNRQKFLGREKHIMKSPKVEKLLKEEAD